MVQVYVSRLRKTLGDGIVLTRRPGYLLGVEREQVDVTRFERLVREGREVFATGDAGSAASCFGEALALWRGPALADFAYEPFAQAEIARLEELRLEAEEERIEAELALGHASQLVAELEPLIAAEPLRERRRSQHMRALYRSGRQADALSAYREARRTFADELGIEPGQELRELERAILAQDERLLATEPVPMPPQSRRTVTLVVAELVGSENNSDDPEADRAWSETAFLRARDVFGQFGGSVEKLPDGSVLSTFGSPVAHEDDCLRAVRAAEELRRLEIVSGAAIETGEIVVGAGAPTSGPVVRAAVRLNHTARPGEIVLSEVAGQLVNDVVALEPVRHAKYLRLVAIAADAPVRPLRLDAPLVGRTDELAGLRGEFARTVEEKQARLVTVVGEPGIGKSRLARELGEDLRDAAQVLVGRCPAYGEGMTYRPLREIVRTAIGSDDRHAVLALVDGEDEGEAIADRIASIFDDAETYSVEELRWAAQRFLRRLAFRQPLLLAIEDAHWAEPTFLDLLDHVVATCSDAPMLVLCLARPEFLDEHRDQVGRTIVLESLSEEESAELLSLLAPGDLAGDRQIVATSSGNPLFLEQLAAFATGRRAAEGTEIIPPTLRSLLAARLDRLGPGERAILERAAVCGHDFWVGGVADLLPPEGRDTLERHLAVLIEKGLVEPGVSEASFERAYRFRHVLIQAAAYRSLPKMRRAELHERLAGWLERNAAAVRGPEEEIVGYHLEQAYGFRAELGAADDRTRALAVRAGAQLSAAGEAALARNDLPAAVNLLTRATALHDAGDQPRLDLLVDLGPALFQLGEGARALTVLEKALEAARAAGELALEWRARLERNYVTAQLEPGSITSAEELETAERAILELEGLGDDRALARAWRSVAQDRFWLGRSERALEASERALEYARRAGDRQEETWMLRQRCMALWTGPTRAAEAIQQCEELLAAASNQTLVACALENLGGLQAMQGNLKEGRRLVERSRVIYEELGLTFRVAVNRGFYGNEVYALSGDLAARERDLRISIELLESIGDKGARSTATAFLADTLYGLGRLAEAERQVNLSEQLAGVDDWASHANIWSVRAKILGRRGELERARAAADEAIGIADATDDLDSRGAFWMDKAEVLRLAGDPDGAASCLDRALDLLERKGNVVLAARARTSLAELGAAFGLRPHFEHVDQMLIVPS
jgi:DNA-binding SARP family transcriptional activator